MENRQDSQIKEQETDHAPVTTADPIESNPVNPSIPDVSSVIENKEVKEAYTDKQGTERQTTISDESLLDRIRKSDRWMIVLTAVIALTGILGWWVTWEQLDILKGQLNEMRTGGTQTEKVITEMNRIAASMEESAKQSKTALEYTIEKSRLDQRAWLTVKAAKVRHIIATGNVPMVAIELHNSGQSPALRTRMDQHVSFIMSKLPEGPMPSISRGGDESIGVVGPDSSVVSDFIMNDPLTEALMTHLKSGKWSIITYGKATYFDIFKVEHQTSFCFILQDIAKYELSPCAKWSSAD